MKTTELSGLALALWTARAEGMTAQILTAGKKLNRVRLDADTCAALTPGFADWWQPYHVYWGICGPIIEREEIMLEPGGHDGAWCAHVWIGNAVAWRTIEGATLLEAAMRAFVYKKYGEDTPE